MCGLLCLALLKLSLFLALAFTLAYLLSRRK